MRVLGRPLIKLSISWRRDGVPVRSGLSDFNRRLTLLSPTISDSGFYECEAELRSSSVPSVSAGAFLHVLGRYRCTHYEIINEYINRSQNIIQQAHLFLLSPLTSDPCSCPPEPPQFVKEPEKHITAEMEKVVDIPCQAKGK